MFSLVLKDILLQKKMLLFAAAYGVILLIFFQDPVFSTMAYIMGATAISYMFVVWSCAYDEKNNSHIVLNSLPISRAGIVRARYASIFLFAILAFGLISILGMMMKAISLPFPSRYPGWDDFLGVFFCLTLFSSLFLPLFFRFGYIKSRIIGIGMFVTVFFIPKWSGDYLMRKYGREIPEQLFLTTNGAGFVVGLVIAALFLLFLSYLLSVHFYRNKQF